MWSAVAESVVCACSFLGVWRASRAESLAMRCVLGSESADASADSFGCDGATARRAVLSRSIWLDCARAAWLVSEPGCGPAGGSLAREFGLAEEPEFPAAALGTAW